MIDILSQAYTWLDQLTKGDAGRTLLSAGLVSAGAAALHLRRVVLSRELAKGDQGVDRRTQLVWSRNLVVAGCALVLLVLWGYKLTGFIFSIAAVAGALVIVNKELIQCLTGYGVLTLTTPYRVGDYVQISRFSGKVIDIRLMHTTLAETGSVHQLNGMTVTVPHGLLLTESVRNMSATGKYLVNLYRIAVPFGADVDALEKVALEAAEEVSQPWREDAEKHLIELEEQSFLDLPSAKPKVLWEPQDSKTLMLLIRFACPADKRVAAEQEVFRHFWRKAADIVKPSQPVAHPD